MIVSLIPAVASFLIVLVLTWLLQHPGTPLSIIDRPGARSLHEQPMPCTGGLAILLGVGVAFFIAVELDVPVADNPFLPAGCLMVGVVSLLDDIRGLPLWPRMVVHFLAAGSLTMGGLGASTLALPGGWTLPLGVLGIPFTLLFTVWFVNLYNFMDGMDGFAGGMGVIGFGWLALLGWQGGSEAMTVTAALISMGSLGFLVFNFPPARIFMGDTGALPMGFMAAALSLWGAREGLFPLWIAGLVFSPFIVDATVTLFRRMVKKEKFWRAHRSHYYQRMVLLGWGHRKTVLAEYLLMLTTGGSAFVLSFMDDRWLDLLVIAAWGFLYVGIGLGIRKAEAGKNSL